ncbi:uncharacterized protein LOC124366213 isoform X2 [Homalodisca vitripennis]|uniref:uncharacterized protein LOC124366213 isoform X2 n=1 Tax=Homalodisca vitripennis TaxID=197043 RepID=UPI001EEB7103|nr:uncharacterized protein LOC124366213 isoform X2 [Homalodisca vitripennis]
MLIDDPRYSEIFQKVEKTKYPTMPEVLQYIEDFFTKDSDTELIFGTDFTKDEREEIQMFARIRKLGYRFYASKATEKEADHIVVFIKRTPQYLRDKLIKSKEDLKYVLIPPSVVGENYDSHINKYEQEHFKEEEKLVHNFWKSVRENYRKDSEENQVIKVIKPENTKQESIKQESKNQESVKQRNVKQESKRLGGRNAVSRNTKSTGRFGANKRQYQEYSRFDDPSRFRNDYMQLQNGRHRQVEGPPPSKRPRQEGASLPSNLPPKISWDIWQKLQPLLIVWPLTICSRLEDRATLVLDANFHVEYFEDDHGSIAVVIRFPMRNGTERRFSVSIAETKNKAADFALQKMLRHSTVIKPNPVYLCDGGVPNFIRYKVPCQAYPRSYIILTEYDTGPLSLSGIRDIFDTFRSSFNEDLFFDKDGYTFDEKMTIIEEAPKFNLNVRHFGDVPGVVNRYVCVYKTKPKEQILEEVLKMRGAHPKYTITTDRLPPHLGLNVF